MPECVPDLPHSGPARLIEAVLEHGADSIRCRGRIPLESPFAAAQGGAPALLAIELGAQAAASHEIVGAAGEGRAGVGYVVSARSVELVGEALPVGEELLVLARRVGAAPPLRTYAFEVVCGGRTWARGEVGTWFEGAAAR